MAKQISDTIITGSFGNIVFYKMYGNGYVRTKSSLTGKQFKTEACFANSRKSAERFKLANHIAGEVYRRLACDRRKYTLFCIMKTTAIRLLKSGLPEAEVKARLEKLCASSVV